MHLILLAFSSTQCYNAIKEEKQLIFTPHKPIHPAQCAKTAHRSNSPCERASASVSRSDRIFYPPLASKPHAAIPPPDAVFSVSCILSRTKRGLRACANPGGMRSCILPRSAPHDALRRDCRTSVRAGSRFVIKFSLLRSSRPSGHRSL